MGRFLMGFAVGAAIGTVVALVLTPKSGKDTRAGVVERVDSTRESIGERITAAVEAGRRASAAREEELWADFREKLNAKRP